MRIRHRRASFDRHRLYVHGIEIPFHVIGFCIGTNASDSIRFERGTGRNRTSDLRGRWNSEKGSTQCPDRLRDSACSLSGYSNCSSIEDFSQVRFLTLCVFTIDETMANILGVWMPVLPCMTKIENRSRVEKGVAKYVGGRKYVSAICISFPLVCWPIW